jgi:DNA invertase Pin-like site-specific DNA recombinase
MTTPIRRLRATIVAAIEAFEREMLALQREAVAAATRVGRRGPPPQTAKHAEVLRLHGEGVGPAEIARRVGMARSSVYRILEG